MGRAFEKVMENRRQLAETLRKNMLDGTIVGKNISGLCESPQNPVSQKAYRGVNRMTLILAAAERGYQDSRWMTFDQIKLQKYHLRKGSKGVLCEYWDFGQEKSDEAELQENMQQPKVGYYYVYNAADVEGIEPYKRKEPTVSEQNSIRSFIQSRLPVQERTALQRGIAQLFTEMEFGITEMVGISAEKEELPATGEIVRAIQQAQLQSEDIIFQYEKSLLQDSEFVEHVPIVLEEKKESRGQEEPLESQGEYAEIIRNDDIGKIEDFGKKSEEPGRITGSFLVCVWKIFLI